MSFKSRVDVFWDVHPFVSHWNSGCLISRLCSHCSTWIGGLKDTVTSLWLTFKSSAPWYVLSFDNSINPHTVGGKGSKHETGYVTTTTKQTKQVWFRTHRPSIYAGSRKQFVLIKQPSQQSSAPILCMNFCTSTTQTAAGFLLPLHMWGLFLLSVCPTSLNRLYVLLDKVKSIAVPLAIPCIFNILSVQNFRLQRFWTYTPLS